GREAGGVLPHRSGIEVRGAHVDVDHGAGGQGDRPVVGAQRELARQAALQVAHHGFDPHHLGQQALALVLVAGEVAPAQVVVVEQCQAAMEMNSRVVTMPAAPYVMASIRMSRSLTSCESRCEMTSSFGAVRRASMAGFTSTRKNRMMALWSRRKAMSLSGRHEKVAVPLERNASSLACMPGSWLFVSPTTCAATLTARRMAISDRSARPLARISSINSA